MRSEQHGAEADGGAEAEDGAPLDQDRRRITEVLAAAVTGLDRYRAPEALCRACAGLLPVTGASISLTASSTVRTIWCASDDTAARLAETQYTLGDGPCRSALELASPVLAADLTQGSDVRRWPVFAQQALDLGVRAAFSLPLGTSALAIGTLDLYRDSPGALSGRDLRIALLVRDAVTFAVLNLHQDPSEDPDPGPDGGVASWVAAAEADHAEAHQAIGMIMASLGVDPDQALDRLRAHAFAHGRTVSEVARDVIARRIRFTSPG
ncbi:GAF and ANTAR domain-containing protein [Streptomyces sp. NPDC087300]|uniref:GAF and ANTAR domain-containing protein n=1 Tax=Streptomyces sp. NPDC087300 TaxID=3365780 RepID=UPI00380D911C